jgi:uncharacterized membrane protein YfhO
MRALSIVNESADRSLIREFYPMRFLWILVITRQLQAAEVLSKLSTVNDKPSFVKQCVKLSGEKNYNMLS